MKKRSEGFFGLHFDFHADSACTEVGKNVTEDMVREIIETIRPDYIQCDCKGHAGYSSYQTKVGNQAPGFLKDQLKIWRKVTKEYGVPLVMHYSGVWDARAVELHPEWAVTNEDGTKNDKMTSTFKGYVDELLIPQLVELANDYKVDAAWIDGECWATQPDFDEKIIALFENESGIKLTKDGQGKCDKQSKGYREFLSFCRNQFFKYLAHYTDEIHRKTKNFEIASNWAFTSFTPCPVCADVDFLSGDLLAVDGYNSARFEARAVCEQGKLWDLMAWGFYYDFEQNCVFSVKSADALSREAASVISFGGGFQIYNTQNRDGSMRLWEMHELKSVAEFVRTREPFLKGSKPFSNIGVLYSYYDLNHKHDSLFYNGGNEDARGAVKLTLDSAHTCTILMDHMLNAEYLKDKNIIILPEIKYISEEVKSALLGFVKNGGNLIISGHECCKSFTDVLDGVTISDEQADKKIAVHNPPRYIPQYAKVSAVTVDENKSEVLRTHRDFAFNADESGATSPIITKTSYGKGSIVAVHYNIFEVYSHAPDFHARNMMSDIIESLDKEKFIEYKGQKFVDIVTAINEGKLLINLTNTSGIYSEIRLRAYDEIQPVNDIEISVKLKKAPQSVVLQPENIIPDYNYDPTSQRLTIKIDTLYIHSVIVIG